MITTENVEFVSSGLFAEAVERVLMLIAEIILPKNLFAFINRGKQIMINNELLLTLQKGIPLEEKPFDKIAASLGLKGKDILIIGGLVIKVRFALCMLKNKTWILLQQN